MTECERIVEQGILPASFFKEETICDFYVDEKRKKIWAVGIDLLVKFDEICRKHDLRYFLAFGSLLGIIRHKGFIPWDDDIDVFMPREDYEKLKLFKDEFKDPYFLQYPGQDNGYAFSFAKLRNSNTSGISWAFRYEQFNQGLFLDIFPMDHHIPQDIEANIGKLSLLIDEGSTLMRRSCPFPDENDLNKLKKFPIARSCKEIVSDTNTFLQQYNNLPTDYYIVWSILTYNYRKIVFRKSLFDDVSEVSYYGHNVIIPKNYEEILKITYDNYKELPPIEKRGVWHSSSIFDADIPYKQTLKLLQEVDRNNHLENK